MRIAGILLLIAGCVVVVAGVNMDTTVEVEIAEVWETPQRVHNLTLAARQDYTILIGCFAALAGIILIGFAECVVPPRDLVGRLTTQTTMKGTPPRPRPKPPTRETRQLRPCIKCGANVSTLAEDSRLSPLCATCLDTEALLIAKPTAPPNIDTREGKSP